MCWHASCPRQCPLIACVAEVELYQRGEPFYFGFANVIDVSCGDDMCLAVLFNYSLTVHISTMSQFLVKLTEIGTSWGRG